MGVGYAYNAQGEYLKASQRAGCAKLIKPDLLGIHLMQYD